MSPPTWGEVSRRVSALLYARGEEWAGLPVPIPNLRLTLEPRNPWRDRLATLEAACHKAEADRPDEHHTMIAYDGHDGDEVVSVRNTWFSHRLGRRIAIYQLASGRIGWALSKHAYVERFQFVFDTLRAAVAWSVDTEATAMETLARLLEARPHLWEAYILTGAFLEISKRSQIAYLFRRCRPTLAFKDDRLLCALCLHPTGFYENTYAGSLCPTDDVIAHLLLMRGDERLFWRRANQHHPSRPEAGL